MRFEVLSVVLMLHNSLNLICTDLAILKSTRRNILGDSNTKVNKDGIHRLRAELNPICHLLTLLGAHHILHVSRIRVKYNVLMIFLLLCKFWYVLAYNRDHINGQLTKCFGFKSGVCGIGKFIIILTRVKIWILAKLKIAVLNLFARCLIYVPSLWLL